MISPISVLVVLNMRKRKWWRQKNVWKRTNFSRFFYTFISLQKPKKVSILWFDHCCPLLDLHFLSSHFWNISYNGHVISTFVSRLRHTSVIFPMYKKPTQSSCIETMMMSSPKNMLWYNIYNYISMWWLPLLWF